MGKQDIAEKVEDYLFGVADAFDNIKRIGSDTDDPEGSRYIIVSDSMAKKLSHDLRNCAHKVAEEKSPWIPVSERLPEPEENVLWCKLQICEPYYCGCMLDTSFLNDYYTHWMLLPPPPE